MEGPSPPLPVLQWHEAGEGGFLLSEAFVSYHQEGFCAFPPPATAWGPPLFLL